MDRFLIEELKNKCNEINSIEANPQMIAKVIEAYDCICKAGCADRPNDYNSLWFSLTSHQDDASGDTAFFNNE